MPTPHPGHDVAGENTQHGSPGTCSLYQHVCHAEPAPPQMIGHVHRMDPSRLPRTILYGELTTGSRPVGPPCLHFKDVCKRDMKQAGIDLNSREEAANDSRLSLQELATLRRGAPPYCRRRDRRGNCDQPLIPVPGPSLFVCANCRRDCHSRVGLHSHNRSCNKTFQAQSIISTNRRMPERHSQLHNFQGQVFHLDPENV